MFTRLPFSWLQLFNYLLHCAEVKCNWIDNITIWQTVIYFWEFSIICCHWTEVVEFYFITIICHYYIRFILQCANAVFTWQPSVHEVTTKNQHIWQQPNVAPQLINLWLAAIFSVFDRVIANRHLLTTWFEFTEFTDASSKLLAWVLSGHRLYPYKA